MSKSFSSALSVVGGVLLWLFIGQSYVLAQTIPTWENVNLDDSTPFDATCEYRFKINTTMNAGGPAGDYWLYANSVHPQNIIYVSHMSQISHVNADSKTVYRVNGTPITYITIQSFQKRCDTSWTNIDLTSTDAFDSDAEYRFRTNAASAGLGISGGDYWSYSNAVRPDSIVYVSHNQTSHINADSKTSYRVDGTPLITVLQIQKRASTSAWNNIPLNSTEPFDMACEYRFVAGNYTHMTNAVGYQSIIYISHMVQTSHINANLKNTYQLDGVGLFGITKLEERCPSQTSTELICGNPRAQVNFVPYAGIPPADQNSSTNAWDSITLGNKAVISGGTFFDITDGTNPIDDGTIVSTGLQNFAVSRHNGYIEFLALGRRLTTYYGYYQGTIKFQNVQVDRVESGLTTATWADIGLEAVEGDTVTKVSDTEVSFKLAFANQGDGFRVYLKNPAPTPCTCPAGQEKKPDPKSPVCIVRALVKGVQDTEFILTGYDHLVGNCTLAAGTPQAPQTPSTEITVTAGQQRTSWMQGSPWTFQLDPLLTCPAGTTKTACIFTYGAGPLGEITCGCYPDTNTNTPKNLSCTIFTNPRVHDKPVHSQSGSPEQFCREQGYTHSVTNINASNFIGNLSKWNGSVWEINPNGLVIDSVSCCKLEDRPSDICVASGCAEGQYWCQSENTCKSAGQTCGAVTCNNNNTCEAGESCNCADCTNGGTDDTDKCGLSSGAQMVCTKDVKNTTTTPNSTTEKWVAYTYPGYASSYIYISKLPTETHTIAGQTFYVYNPERVIRGMSETTFMANPEDAIKNAPVITVGNTRWTERLIFNKAQLESETAPTQTTVINSLTSFVAHKYMCTQNAVGATNCSNNSDMGWTPSFGKALNGDIYVSNSNSGSGVTFTKGQILGTFDVANTTCQPYSTSSSLRYIPNTRPTTQGWLNINGIGTAQDDNGKSVWQVNDGGNDSGDNAVVYKKFSTTELGDFFTRGGKYSVELKNISASAPTSGAAYLLASYLEIARGANTTKGARRFTFVFGLDTDKTPTVIGLTSNGTTYTTPSNSTYKYRVDGGANKYNTYDMVYDPATDTVDMFVNGVERISNFPGNTVAPGYATQINGTAAIIFGSGTSPGVANTNYGNIAVSIKNNCPGSSIQVGACCPAGSQWDSSQGKCVLPGVPGCAEGEYYCHTELKCKAAGATCGTVTCNNNNICDTNESCDCADCNEKVDHCGLSNTGEQMICTKDTAPTCYTDKFPYCLSACLDGYTRNATGQCVPTVPLGVPQNCSVRSVQGIEGSVALCDAGEVRVGGGCENTNGGAYRFFTFPLIKGENWWNYTNIAQDGWACGSGSTGTYTKAYAVCCTAPTTGTYNLRKGTPGIGSKAECLAGEVRTGGGCKNLGGSAYLPVSYPLAAGSTFGSLGAVTYDGWGCATGASDTTTEAYAICYTPGTGPSFQTTIRTQVGTELATAECQPGEVRTGGGCSLISGTAYHYAIFPSLAGAFNGYSTTINDGFVCATGSTGTYTQAYAVCASKANTITTANNGSQSFTYPIKDDGFVKDDAASVTKYCTEKGFTSGSVLSSSSSGARKSIWNGTAWVYSGDASSYSKEIQCSGGPIIPMTCQNYVSPKVNGNVLSLDPGALKRFCSEKSYTEVFMVGQAYTGGTLAVWNGTSWGGNLQGYYATELNCCNIGTVVPPESSSCKNFTYPTLDNTNVATNSYVANTDASANQFCTSKGYTSGTLIAGGNIGSISNIALEVKCCGGNVVVSCENYPNPAIGGGAVIVRPSSLGQFCREKGKPEPFMKSWNMFGTVAIWNGTSWYGNEVGGGAISLDCCTLTAGAAPTTTTTEPQLGACCPPGSAWNSVENRCIPTTCGEGQFYCAAQKKCLVGGTPCDDTICVNDGVCSGEESCQCGDCVNGGGDDKDKCSIVGGVQAMCSDDNPSDGKPGACCVPPKKWNSTTNTCVECSNTQAPSELKAGVDQPYITCTGNGDSTKTHFRYRITKQGATETPFISEPFTIGTQVLHPTMTLGDYTVECFYGNATGVDTSTTAAPHSCVKTMSVKSDAQGCSRVYPYKENTLSDEMISSNAFDASFRCGSRKPVLGTITNPYMFRVGTQAASYLSFDALISELFNGLTIGPVSTQTQNYSFNTGNTDVTCATKVGGGYSTNTACQLRTCVGGACNVPQTFSVVHSDDLICTTDETSTYNIGCNPAAPDSVRNQCIQWFRDAVNAGSRSVPNGVEFDVSFVFNGDAPTNVTCIKYIAGQMPGGLNLSDNVVCSADLKNGERYQIYAADTNGRIDALQTTAKTVERDGEKPSMADIKYYTDESLTTEVQPTNWYNKPVIALAVCSDTPLNEATSCACAQRVDATNTTDADAWSLGVPNSLIGADLMRYTKTITETLTGIQKVQVIDTAGNTSSPKNIAVSLDTQAPLVTPAESGTGAIKTITLTASDTGSKIWKTTTAPSGATNSSGIIYRIGAKADMATLAFNAECNTTATYATVSETQSASFPGQATATISNINTATQVVAYCVRDNAGNTTRGMYPVVTDACFSASNMSTIPNLDTYKALLKTRLTATGTDNQKYGYSFSENTTDAQCFRGILGTNITTLMANQLKPRTSTTLSNWDRDRAELSTSTTLSNGYYYYVYPTSNTLNIVTSPSGGAPVKSVVVEGGDIRIKTDINYSGAGKTLLLIARKNSNGQGGNIIIDTNVRNIDAILIADGGALRSSDATLPGERLTINGRVYSYNTRGGSLAISGTDFIDATTPKKFTNSSLVSASSLNDARIQDLERFRPIFADGNNTCSLTVNYTAFTTANLPALLKRPNTFTGGSCGF